MHRLGGRTVFSSLLGNSALPLPSFLTRFRVMVACGSINWARQSQLAASLMLASLPDSFWVVSDLKSYKVTKWISNRKLDRSLSSFGYFRIGFSDCLPAVVKTSAPPALTWTGKPMAETVGQYTCILTNYFLLFIFILLKSQHGSNSTTSHPFELAPKHMNQAPGFWEAIT